MFRSRGARRSLCGIFPGYLPVVEFVGRVGYGSIIIICKAKDGGILARDRADFRVPGGTLVFRWLIRKDLERTFRFRQERLLCWFFGSLIRELCDRRFPGGSEVVQIRVT